MSDSNRRDDDAPDDGMGVVRRRRNRKLLEARQAKGSPSPGGAASAWGEHLQRGGGPAAEAPPPQVARRRGPDALGGSSATGPRKRIQAVKAPDDAALPQAGDGPSVEEVLEQLAEAHDADAQRQPAGGAGNLARHRPLLTGLALVAATLIAALPVFEEHRQRTQAAALDAAVTAQAERLADALPDLERWLTTRSVDRLRTVHAEHLGGVVEGLRAAGFEKADKSNVTLRVDFARKALVVTAAFEQADGQVLGASAATAGGRVGAPPPEPGFGAAAAEHRSLIVSAYLMALIAIAGLWFGPSLVARFRRS